VPGEENLDVMESLANSEQIDFVTTRHEQGAAFMAPHRVQRDANHAQASSTSTRFLPA
jgi:thiamine pyrophosphate-dependent acetolactate synthase large subunit-like protein